MADLDHNAKPTEDVDLREVFGVDSDMKVKAFATRSDRVPEIDATYKFDHDTTLAILAGFAYNRRVMIQGYHGTGKSTHYCLWKLLCPDAVQIINGDKPIVYMENDQVFVTSSPWTGKENMSQRLTAKLGGIIFLEQAKTNEIRRLTVHESAGKIFSQFLFDCNTEQEVKSACKIAENMLKSPVWLLKNRGDIQSAQLCRDTLAAALSDPAMNLAKSDKNGEKL